MASWQLMRTNWVKQKMSAKHRANQEANQKMKLQLKCQKKKPEPE
jgi:hypothetical protein